jgi:hypothetical protein
VKSGFSNEDGAANTGQRPLLDPLETLGRKNRSMISTAIFARVRTVSGTALKPGIAAVSAPGGVRLQKGFASGAVLPPARVLFQEKPSCLRRIRASRGTFSGLRRRSRDRRPRVRPSCKYSFVTGDASDPAAPSAVEWRDGKGINTGRHVLAAVDYLYDAARGLIGFRSAAND